MEIVIYLYSSFNRTYLIYYVNSMFCHQSGQCFCQFVSCICID